MKKWAGYLAIGLGVVGVNWFFDAKRDETGAIVSAGNIDAFQIQVGDCFDDRSTESSGEVSPVTAVRGVPCAQPHDNEVYAVFDISLTEFPGEAMARIAFDSCLERFAGFVGRDYESSSLDIMALYPSQESWQGQRDREVVCAVYDVGLGKLEGSVEGLAL